MARLRHMETLVLTLLVFVFVLGALNDTAVTAEEFFLIPLVLVATMTSATVGALVASRQSRDRPTNAFAAWSPKVYS